MTERPGGLPDFAQPPVVEVVAGCRFAPTPGFRQAHIGLYWDQIREAFPTTDDKPRLEGPGPAGFHIEFLEAPPTQRAWFLSETEDQLIQLQNDRFTFNWRRQGGLNYPRFEAVSEQFESYLEKLRTCWTSAGLELGSLQQLEVTYVNWLPDTDLAGALAYIEPHALGIQDEMRVPADEQWRGSYPWSSDAGPASLVVDAKTAVRRDEDTETSGVLLTLSYTGDVSDHDPDHRPHLRAGREAIVRAFADVTRTELHEVWGRRQ
jgi:uncharacterized protein (TIGR04255 family)